MGERLNISSGAPWEELIGYSRAVRTGNVIEVAGTASVDEQGNIIGINNAYEQAKYVLEKIERALNLAGAALTDVVRTRIYLTDISRWEEIGKAHGEFFKTIKPVTSMIEVRALINPGMLVEIEATAHVLS